MNYNEIDDLLGADEPEFDAYDPSGRAASAQHAPISQKEVWETIDAHFRDRGLVKQNIESFNEFCENTLQQAVADGDPIILEQTVQNTGAEEDAIVRHKLVFGQVYLQAPRTRGEYANATPALMPQNARLRDMTYAGKLLVDIDEYKKDDQDEDYVFVRTLEAIPLGRIPIMLRSSFCHLRDIPSEQAHSVDECKFDQGGYFIVKGNERALVGQEFIAQNTIIVEKDAKAEEAYIATVRSFKRGCGYRTRDIKLRMEVKSGKEGKRTTIGVAIPNVQGNIPLVIVMRALGLTSDKTIAEHCCYDLEDEEAMAVLTDCLREASVVQDREIALDFIGKRGTKEGSAIAPYAIRIRTAENILQTMLFPHMGVTAGSNTGKAFYLGYMCHRLLMAAFQRSPFDDRDHFGRKRVQLAGPLMEALFRKLFAQVKMDLRREYQQCLTRKKDFEPRRAIREETITNGINKALKTGNWGVAGATAASGVSQLLIRLTHMASLSHLRRVTSPLSKRGQLALPRLLHGTQWGYICPCETPEGQAVGLVKNLALMASASVGHDSGPIIRFLLDYNVLPLTEISPSDVMHATKVFVDGSWIGISHNADELVMTLRRMRRFHTDPMNLLDDNRPILTPEVTIVRDVREREVRIFCDVGRLLRPLFVVDLQHQRLALQREHLITPLPEELSRWQYLVEQGCIEYLDAQEEETAFIAMTVEQLQNNADSTKTYTHSEIHPSMILGVCASVIPFPDHNQSPRNVYQSAMGKQAMGIYTTNFLQRMDTVGNVLYYPQRPLCGTNSMKYLEFNEIPAGQNAIVAIQCYSGYNQEDSVIMNQSAIDRGLFRSLHYHTYSESERQKLGRYTELIAKPDMETTTGIRGDPITSNAKLDEDGLVALAENVSGGDKIIGKVTPLPPNSEELGERTDRSLYRDLTEPLRSSDSGTVDRVLLTVGEESLKLARVRIRTTRKPQMGDKFASRHGQKGTVGITYRQEDMPFTSSGMTPDIIINPHAIPSRMTIGHLVECLLGKVGAIEGSFLDATPFNPEMTVDYISGLLKEHGFHPRGYETLFNGHTGRKIRASVFFGPTYYQRLKHMVDDKVHARARGPYQLLTRQPVAGRSRAGGLRFGEMEQDCFVAHGAAHFLKDRMMDVSDAYRVHVCEECGFFATAKLEQQQFLCKGCNNKTNIAQVFMPYACKLLFQELMSMQIAPRLKLV